MHVYNNNEKFKYQIPDLVNQTAKIPPSSTVDQKQNFQITTKITMY